MTREVKLVIVNRKARGSQPFLCCCLTEETNSSVSINCCLLFCNVNHGDHSIDHNLFSSYAFLYTSMMKEECYIGVPVIYLK